MPKKRKIAGEISIKDFIRNRKKSSRKNLQSSTATPRNNNNEKPHQRNAANARERTRMRVLSRAFCRLKTTLPWVPADTKLSKLDTLRLASSYIAHLKKELEEDEIETDSIYPPRPTWPFGFNRTCPLNITSPEKRDCEDGKKFGEDESLLILPRMDSQTDLRDCIHLDHFEEIEDSYLSLNIRNNKGNHPVDFEPHYPAQDEEEEEVRVSELQAEQNHNKMLLETSSSTSFQENILSIL